LSCKEYPLLRCRKLSQFDCVPSWTFLLLNILLVFSPLLLKSLNNSTRGSIQQNASSIQPNGSAPSSQQTLSSKNSIPINHRIPHNCNQSTSNDPQTELDQYCSYEISCHSVMCSQQYQTLADWYEDHNKVQTEVAHNQYQIIIQLRGLCEEKMKSKLEELNRFHQQILICPPLPWWPRLSSSEVNELRDNKEKVQSLQSEVKQMQARVSNKTAQYNALSTKHIRHTGAATKCKEELTEANKNLVQQNMDLLQTNSILKKDADLWGETEKSYKSHRLFIDSKMQEEQEASSRFQKESNNEIFSLRSTVSILQNRHKDVVQNHKHLVQNQKHFSNHTVSEWSEALRLQNEAKNLRARICQVLEVDVDINSEFLLQLIAKGFNATVRTEADLGIFEQDKVWHLSLF